MQGYKGRVGIHEVMVTGEAIAEAILRGEPVRELRKVAREQGMKTLLEDGLDKCLAGLTTPDEVRRVLAIPL